MFLSERSLTGLVYLNMFYEFFMPILEQDQRNDILSQQNGTRHYFRTAFWAGFLGFSVRC